MWGVFRQSTLTALAGRRLEFLGFFTSNSVSVLFSDNHRISLFSSFRQYLLIHATLLMVCCYKFLKPKYFHARLCGRFRSNLSK